MNEFELIKIFFSNLPCSHNNNYPIILGIGDDCGIINTGKTGKKIAISTDTLASGSHFPIDCDPYLVGYRVLAVALSDLAAVGATPIAFTIALTIPSVDVKWLESFSKGLNCAACCYKVCLIGGDTTKGPLSVTLTVMGSLPLDGDFLGRGHAKEGDILCVGGKLGDAAGALPLVLGKRKKKSTKNEKYLLSKYWKPQPQIALGKALRGKANAAIDISDGLLADCRHIASASEVKIVIESELLPISKELVRFIGIRNAREAALRGGDDYILAFTIPKKVLSSVLKKNKWPIYRIGYVTKGEGIQLLDSLGKDIILKNNHGYNHFP